MPKSRLCSIPDCGKPAKIAGMCWAHYCRIRRHGDASVVKKPPNGTVQDYFRDVVLPYDGDECLCWPFGKDQNGYARLAHEGRMYPVHRLVCEIANGPPPSLQHEAAHNCGNGRLGCVTRRHMRWATPRENSADKIRHGTDNRGEKHYRARLTREQVAEIRLIGRKSTLNEIAKTFGVSEGCISRVLSGGTWKHM